MTLIDLNKKELELISIALNEAKLKGLKLPITNYIKDLEESLIKEGLGCNDISIIKRGIETIPKNIELET